MAHVYFRDVRRLHTRTIRACVRVPFDGTSVVACSRVEAPLYSFERSPVAGPSTATLGPGTSPVVFLRVVDRTRRSRVLTHAVVTRART